MECNNCGNDKAYGWRKVFAKEGSYEECNGCSDYSFSISIPDVYWKGAGYHPGILDKDNNPIFLHSRKHKAKVMRELNLREAGDFYHGSRGTETEKFEKSRLERQVKHKEDVKRAGKIFRDGVTKLKKAGKI